jgi:hypothetical protein
MRIFSYILIGLGVLLLASAGYDELRGSTRAPSSRYTGYSHYAVTKQAKPEEFYNAMLIHWSRSFLLSLAGVILFMIDRGQEKVDPIVRRLKWEHWRRIAKRWDGWTIEKEGRPSRIMNPYHTTESPNPSPQPTAVTAAVAIHATSRRWLNFLRSIWRK